MIFKPAARYPADPRAVFVLVVSVFTGLTALALEIAPESINSYLPYWGVLIWGILLCVGSLVTLAGMAFQSVNGIIAEQIGSVMVGATTVFYAAVALYFNGAAAVQGTGIILAWGLSCFLRWGQLQVLINNAHRREIRERTLNRVYAEIEERAARESAARRAHPSRFRP